MLCFALVNDFDHCFNRGFSVFDIVKLLHNSVLMNLSVCCVASTLTILLDNLILESMMTICLALEVLLVLIMVCLEGSVCAWVFIEFIYVAGCQLFVNTEHHLF